MQKNHLTKLKTHLALKKSVSKVGIVNNFLKLAKAIKIPMATIILNTERPKE